jgi:hypothetical protein
MVRLLRIAANLSEHGKIDGQCQTSPFTKSKSIKGRYHNNFVKKIQLPTSLFKNTQHNAELCNEVGDVATPRLSRTHPQHHMFTNGQLAQPIITICSKYMQMWI